MPKEPTTQVRIRAELVQPAKVAAAQDALTLEQWLNRAIEAALARKAAAARRPQPRTADTTPSEP